MPWIRTISNDDAAGSLREQYDAAVKRAGRVYNILRIMSLNPAALEAAMGMYRATMFGRSPLSRAVRELLATVTSAVNTCHY